MKLLHRRRHKVRSTGVEQLHVKVTELAGLRRYLYRYLRRPPSTPKSASPPLSAPSPSLAWPVSAAARSLARLRHALQSPPALTKENALLVLEPVLMLASAKAVWAGLVLRTRRLAATGQCSAAFRLLSPRETRGRDSRKAKKTENGKRKRNSHPGDALTLFCCSLLLAHQSSGSPSPTLQYNRCLSHLCLSFLPHLSPSPQLISSLSISSHLLAAPLAHLPLIIIIVIFNSSTAQHSTVCPSSCPFVLPSPKRAPQSSQAQLLLI
ncbi:hypothetical protein TgHK011_001500 [Trichoderma gracile]|nr:hypothetical protein TgHK011_001500 [Trichoderma gracile]